MPEDKVYKLRYYDRTSMLPGDPLGSPDESFILLNLLNNKYGRNYYIY